ncbi:acyl-CoA dehydrogenase family protein [Microbacterium sp. NPDC058062]|uniref:acyl-CoA dehydrogenase family protein n=1 Tax=Microbacterium sp. NPDC058062 TaxID=3346320 RepID=UPI0036D9E099
MNRSLLLTDEQEEFREVLRAVLEKTTDLDRIRVVPSPDADFDHRAWDAVVELGAVATLVSTDHGGLGLGLTEASIVLAEAGRSFAAAPVFTSLLASAAIAATDDDQLKEELLPAIAQGSLIVALAFTEDPRSWIPSTPAVRASSDGATRVSGTKTFVRDGQFADVLLVLTAEGLVVLDPTTSGVTRTPVSVLDASVFAARVDFALAEGRTVAVHDLAGYLEHVDAVASVLLAATQHGAYERALELTVQYAKDRVQFGRSIGSFQAVKHPLAEWAMEAELASALLRDATSLADASHDAEFIAAALVVQVKMQRLAFTGAAWMARVHGGIGYTWEHDAHLYLKQARTSQLLLGTPAVRAQRLARALAI